MAARNAPTMTATCPVRDARPGPDLARRDLRGRNLRGLDFEGADLRDADLRHADLRGADLFGARLQGARLEGCRLDMGRVAEICVPEDLDLTVVNQIRAFDFARAMTRFVGPNRGDASFPCPYRNAALRPFFYEWGSRTWNGGRGWQPPAESWTAEEIIAAVLDALGCVHELTRPFSESSAAPESASS